MSQHSTLARALAGTHNKPLRRWREERGACPECGKSVATYVPKGGDGSARLFRSHKRKGPAGVTFICAGTRREDPKF